VPDYPAKALPARLGIVVLDRFAQIG